MSYSNFKRLAFVLLAPAMFLIVSILTLSDYGINWDSPKHFIRGQAYLHFVLTGNKNFLDYPTLPNPKGAPDTVDFNVEGATNSSIIKQRTVDHFSGRRSYFQSDFYTFDYFMTRHVHTHPEVNDFMTAFSNFIFYQKLGLFGDIEAYHLFVVLVTLALISAISLWVYHSWGILASVVSTFSLAAYPLVFAESHFNIKDPVLMAFFGLAILSFSVGFSNRKPLFIIISALSAGLALGTKFNVIFLPLILGPWFLFNVILRIKNRKVKKLKWISLLGGSKMLVCILLYPFIALSVLFVLSPYLWVDPVGHFFEIVNYYKGIGVGTPEEQSPYLVSGWNIYPLVWILITTPLPILLLSLLGLFQALFLSLKKRSDIAFLILLWFVVPIIRVMWPGTNIYGGVRQIMEFVPAMAILAGVGVFFLHKILPSKLVVVSISLSLIFVGLELVRIHPFENVYFNQLIGGLSGARDRRIPSWGNSYGNVYLQGINWLNKNAEINARLTLPVNYISSIPRLKLRNDIALDSHYFSGQAREGEYAMEMYYDWPLRTKYKYAYYETFLYPVHEVVVDGVPLLKVWKNDLLHTKSGFEKEIVIDPLSIEIEQQKLKINFASQVFLTRLAVDYSVDNCQNQIENGFIAVSEDGINFIRESNPLYDLESPEISPGMDEDTFVYMFPARSALSIIFNPQQPNPCVFKDIKVTVWGLEKNP